MILSSRVVSASILLIVAIVFVSGVGPQYTVDADIKGATGNRRWTYSRAELYYVDWDMTTVPGLSPASVRRSADVAAVYGPTVAGLLREWLGNQLQRMPPFHPTHDVRLVLVFNGPHGAESFYATQFGLYSEDGSVAKGIDDTFKDTIRRMMLPKEVFSALASRK